jgi:hypothetical protein
MKLNFPLTYRIGVLPFMKLHVINDNLWIHQAFSSIDD